MFLKPTAKPVPRCTPSPVGRVACAAREPDRVARQLLGAAAARARRRGGSPRPSAASPRRPGRSAACRPAASAFSSRSSTGSISSAAASLSICASRGEAGLHGAEAAHRAARRVVRVDAGRLDQRVRHLVRPAGEGRRVRGDGRRATRRRRRRRAGSASARRRAGRRGSRGAPPRSAPGGGGRGRRTTPRGRRRASPGGSVCSASIAPWICIDRSSRPPNAPPTPARWIRTCSGSRPRHGATWSRSTCSHCVAT